MNTIISIFGPPYSGKTTFLIPYSSNVFYMGKYLRSLIKEENIDEEIKRLVSQGVPLEKDLFSKLFFSIPFPKKEEIILDGMPRNMDQAKIMNKKFNFEVGIEIIVSNDIWLSRIKSAEKDRPERKDSSIEILKERRRNYFADIDKIKRYFNHWHQIDNSGDLNTSTLEFSILLRKYYKTERSL